MILLCSGPLHILCNISRHFFRDATHACATAGLIACPGRPHVCIRPEESCLLAPGPWLCPTVNHTVCGLQRDGSGKLVIGSNGSPVPNCILSTDTSADACGRLGLKPLPANLTGGSGSSQGWAAVQMSGILPSGSPAGVIANIGSDGYSGGPAYFVGNGSDSTEVVKVCRCSCKVYGVKLPHLCCAVHRNCSRRLGPAVRSFASPLSPFFFCCVCHALSTS